ncbi:FIST C-terminal domain-containing protein [Marinobacteraceae bacterium S3BR75-40.1]
MKVSQHVFKSAYWHPELPSIPRPDVDWIFCTASPEVVEQLPMLLSVLKEAFPSATLIGCTTAGEISDVNVFEGSLCATAVCFEKTALSFATAAIGQPEDSVEAGRRIAEKLAAPDLNHVLVISEGLNVNGTALAQGIMQGLPDNVRVTGGLAGDGSRFGHTQVWLNQPNPGNQVVAVGFYGQDLAVGWGSQGGWDTFGPDREITASQGNILYQLDGRSALKLYKDYLGDYARDLPASGLLFPLAVTLKDGTTVVRTVLGVDEDAESMTFAGDLPQGASARFMKANFDRLIEGAEEAATETRPGCPAPELALLISCVGRKMVLGQRIEEEVEVTRDALGEQAVLAGFYSYGEISPRQDQEGCALHNQTMTITTFREL